MCKMIDIYDMTHADEVKRPVRGGKANTLQSRTAETAMVFRKE